MYMKTEKETEQATVEVNGQATYYRCRSNSAMPDRRRR